LPDIFGQNYGHNFFVHYGQSLYIIGLVYEFKETNCLDREIPTKAFA